MRVGLGVLVEVGVVVGVFVGVPTGALPPTFTILATAGTPFVFVMKSM